MNKSSIFALAAAVILNLGFLVAPQHARANISPYSPPCQDSDVETSGGCCPDGTQIVHNMCLTQDEIDERNERSQNFMQCSVGNGLDHNVPGLLQCGRDFFGP